MTHQPTQLQSNWSNRRYQTCRVVGVIITHVFRALVGGWVRKRLKELVSLRVGVYFLSFTMNEMNQLYCIA